MKLVKMIHVEILRNAEGKDKMTRADECLQSSVMSCSETTATFVSKISRHLKTNMAESKHVKALSLLKNSKECKVCMEQLRNEGLYQHNSDVIQNGTGTLKARRRPNRTRDLKEFVHFMYCKGLYCKDLW